jgi:hypothetical protein
MIQMSQLNLRKRWNNYSGGKEVRKNKKTS